MQQTCPTNYSIIAVLLIGCLAFAGCDVGGSDGPSPETFTVEIENVGAATPVLKSGAFTTPVGGDGPAPIKGGDSYEVTFTAGPNEIPNSGMRLSFATMFIQSNDLYYAFEPSGLSLFDEDGTPIGQNGAVDVTSEINLYDAGTEGDQSPGSGADQAPRQSGLNVGPDGEGTVTEVTDTDGDDRLEDNGFSYPATEDVIEVAVESTSDSDSGGYEFTLTITNVGATVNDTPIPLSPGSYAVHWDQAPSGDDVTYPGHAPGAEAGSGIEAIAEDGRPAGALPPDTGTPAGNHVQALRDVTGVTVPLSPGAYAVHSNDVSFYEMGNGASVGIESIAEDGRPGEMRSMLRSLNGVKRADVFNTPRSAEEPGPLTPGNSYSFSVEAVPGDRLSLATMYIQSNDLFYALPPQGIALYDANDQPVSGDVTDQVMLYDAGTEGDQEPGVGLDQAPRQSGLDTGPSGEGTITAVDGDDDGFRYPAANDIIRVTISPPSTAQ